MDKKVIDLLIVGSVSAGSRKIGGQTIKTRNIVQLLRDKSPEEMRVRLFDTAQLNDKKRRIFRFFRHLMSSDIVVIIPAHESLKYLYPWVCVLNCIKDVPFIHIVVGGWLDKFVKKYPFYIHLLRRARVILTQSKALRDHLASKYGLSNISVLHNFKILARGRKMSECTPNEAHPLRIVHLARISEAKGSRTVLEVGQRLMHAGYSKDEIRISLYGPISAEFKSEFMRMIDAVELCTYHGAVDPDRVNSVLATYDCMLFPTTYPNEGFPGVILDAYIAGIPVIATKWRQLPEFIHEGQSGFLLKPNSVEEIVECIESIMSNREMINKLKRGARESYDEYSVDRAWEILSTYTT